MGPKAPVVHEEAVKEAWLDYNGHLNEAYYLLVFSHATDALLERIGMAPAERERHAISVFTLETHLLYLLEVGRGARLVVEVRILEHDTKRLRVFLTMRAAGAEAIVATAEMVILHVDMRTRRGAPFREEVARAVAVLHEAEAERPWPAQAGRAIGLRR